MKRDFDLIVYGATGYTGHLIAEYRAASYRCDDAPSWAIAGRSADKLQKVRADIGAPDDLPLVKADAAEPATAKISYPTSRAAPAPRRRPARPSDPATHRPSGKAQRGRDREA